MESNSAAVDKTNKALAMLAIMRLIEKKRKTQHGRKSTSKAAR
ncbi:MAG TPA: hypothetical protein VGO93_02565 [Candidatus Xenobia bacterium]|jgi:hypothetical protein